MYCQKMKLNSHWQDTCEKKGYLPFLSKFASTCCFDLLKKEYTSNFNKSSLKKEQNYYLKPYFLLHLMCYIAHTELIFQNLLLYCIKKVTKNHDQFFRFRHGGETHFLVLAQTLIYA